MGNIIDYIKWRGDLPLSKISFNDIDLLILSELVYADMHSIVPSGYSSSVSVRDACIRLLVSPEEHSFGSEDCRALLTLLMKSDRFRDMQLTAYVDISDERAEEQFCGMTVLLPDGTAAVVFRGTDATINGWKEDFNLSFVPEVPAQRDAAEYLSNAGSALSCPLYIAGHSKGGNLAVYSAALSDPKIQARIIGIVNFDGPGFEDRMFATASYMNICSRIRTYVPKSSVIGMLFSHLEEFTVVDSRNIGIFQHNPFNWEIMGNGFTTVRERTNSSYFIDSAMKDFLNKIDPGTREKIINTVFSILSEAGIRNVQELYRARNIPLIIRISRSLDPESREVLHEALRLFKGSVKDTYLQLTKSSSLALVR